MADADDARVSMILETLAANRGKSIYCAIDQSDTWTKAETWEAGRYRNERDDTVYFGQSGNFRGFLAAQEGYLTDGESGVTGVSRELIFEFPREQRRGWKTVRFAVPTDGSKLASGYSCSYHPVRYSSDSSAKSTARRYFTGDSGSCPVTTDWAADADAAAQTHCRRRGGRVVAGSVEYDASTVRYEDGGNPIWDHRPFGSGNGFSYTVRQLRDWSATCKKRVRRR